MTVEMLTPMVNTPIIQNCDSCGIPWFEHTSFCDFENCVMNGKGIHCHEYMMFAGLFQKKAIIK